MEIVAATPPIEGFQIALCVEDCVRADLDVQDYRVSRQPCVSGIVYMLT